MDERKKVLITGASGLLGGSLVKTFEKGGWSVVAHFHRNKGEHSEFCQWVSGDFSTLFKTRKFIEKNADILKKCSAVINNYGPITYKNTAEITAEDLITDFHGNLIVAHEITSSLIRSRNLRTVVNIAFEGVGQIKPYRKILSYSIAKSALQLLTRSYDREYPDINFFLVSPPSLAGGEYGKVSGEYKEPDEIADEIYRIVSGKSDV